MTSVLQWLRRLLSGRRPQGARPRLHVMLALDIARFTSRDEAMQIHLREVMYRIVDEAYVTARAGRRLEDRGDGIFMIVGPRTGLDVVLSSLIQNIRAGIREHNRNAVPAARIQLRMALHAGFLHEDAHGVAGSSVNRLFRLLDAPVMKDRLAVDGTDFALVMSDYVYEAATGYHLVDAADFEMIRVEVKETCTDAWLWTAPAEPWPRLAGHA
ncbi:hypothetical protein [Actinomadura chokoriensis]|uniref:hypothetical protein n=1 Tax=Actinomadura chokoriensis TaxID=454156 RepID=UPI0031F9C901